MRGVWEKKKGESRTKLTAIRGMEARGEKMKLEKLGKERIRQERKGWKQMKGDVRKGKETEGKTKERNVDDEGVEEEGALVAYTVLASCTKWGVLEDYTVSQNVEEESVLEFW